MRRWMRCDEILRVRDVWESFGTAVYKLKERTFK